MTTIPRRARTENELAVARTVGRNVRAMRTLNGLTMAQLAEKTAATAFPLHLVTVQKIETGRNPSGSPRAVTVDELVALAGALGVPPERLLAPPACGSCYGLPPVGFTCNSCGASVGA